MRIGRHRWSRRLGGPTLVLGLGIGLGAFWATPNEGEWPWPDSLDAVAAAGESHEVLLENERVRVLLVSIEPGQCEPRHTHRWPSVMILEEPARIRYYGGDDEVLFESPEGERTASASPATQWMAPEGAHSVENLDTRRFLAYRIELKQGD